MEAVAGGVNNGKAEQRRSDEARHVTLHAASLPSPAVSSATMPRCQDVTIPRVGKIVTGASSSAATILTAQFSLLTIHFSL